MLGTAIICIFSADYRVKLDNDLGQMSSFFKINKLNKRKEKESGNRAILSDSKQFLKKIAQSDTDCAQHKIALLSSGLTRFF